MMTESCSIVYANVNLAAETKVTEISLENLRSSVCLTSMLVSSRKQDLQVSYRKQRGSVGMDLWNMQIGKLKQAGTSDTPKKWNRV
jgi:hypothetical protein